MKIDFYYFHVRNEKVDSEKESQLIKDTAIREVTLSVKLQSFCQKISKMFPSQVTFWAVYIQLINTVIVTFYISFFKKIINCTKSTNCLFNRFLLFECSMYASLVLWVL